MNGLVEFRNASDPCPNGFICDGSRMANCSQIRELARSYFQFGDIHAGAYCPQGSDVYRNCPQGYYCPTPEELIPCPDGKFCPHKTAVPELSCRLCEEGATSLPRETYGYVIIALLLALALVFFIFVLVKRYQKEAYKRFVELTDRRIDSFRANKHRKERQKLLERLRPKLEIVAKRLKQQDESSPIHLPPVGSGESIRVNSKKLFEALDVNHDSVLSYQELNEVLDLNAPQLYEFVRRMNEMAGLPPTNEEIPPKVFQEFFLDVLAESSHFGPSRDEAAQLYDEIAAQGATAANGDVFPEAFYTSTLADFLTDSQINDLLVRLRRIKMGGAGPAASDRSQHSWRDRVRWNATSTEFHSHRAIGKDLFVQHYPRLLNDIILRPDPVPLMSVRPEDLFIEDNDVQEHSQVDIAFEDLSLSVKVGDNSVHVVDHVTGRLQAKTMTALMGGSGAGKTSLLNALCGRAFYGHVTGTLKLNGHSATIEDHSSVIGFVPQDDIVYAELTVRENFIFSGRFQLPEGTPMSDIEDLADATLASLGLSRVAHSVVGDVTRRGVSGGEKKRVNIGLELMSRPSVLFLDEPTSGLDASSALIVMKSLRTLVDTQGVTICSVIHQPRKFIYDLFDSLILLGVGGRMVYHGPTKEAEAYFNALNYSLPPGESVADWLIDISSGRLKPEEPLNKSISDLDGSMSDIVAVVGTKGDSGNRDDNDFEEAKLRREVLYRNWEKYFKTLGEEMQQRYMAPDPYDIPKPSPKPSFRAQLKAQLQRNMIVLQRNSFSTFVDTAVIVGAVILTSAFAGVTKVTIHRDPRASFDDLVSTEPADLVRLFPELFAFAYRAPLLDYALTTGVITSVLVGLTATKILTEKRIEFFREAGSGYDVNAYFLSVNITSTIEHSIQIILSALFAFWLRDSIAAWHSYYVNFLLLTWICVSWALLLPLLVPPRNVVLVTGFFMAFFGLLFSGSLEPVLFDDIYNGNQFWAFFSAFFATPRFFVESLVVAEFRCLPPQSGFTIVADQAVNFPKGATSFDILSLARNDAGVVDRSCSGWYWSGLPAFMVGLTVRLVAAGVIHVSERSKQSKISVWRELGFGRDGKHTREQNLLKLFLVLYLCICACSFALSLWFILRDV